MPYPDDVGTCVENSRLRVVSVRNTCSADENACWADLQSNKADVTLRPRLVMTDHRTGPSNRCYGGRTLRGQNRFGGTALLFTLLPYVGPIVDMAVTSSATVGLRPPNVTSSMYPRTSSLE